MKTVKQVGLMIPMVVLTVVFAATLLWAGKPLPRVQHYTYVLVPPADSPELDASGKCTFETYAKLPVSVAVSCRDLMPSCQYRVVHVTSSPEGLVEEAAYAFTSDARGRFEGDIHYAGYTVDLWVANAAGDVVLVVGQMKN